MTSYCDVQTAYIQ